MEKAVGLYNFDESVDPPSFSRDLRRWGIPYAILSPLFFKTSGMARALARERVKVWLNLPIFYNPAHLELHPEDYCITSSGRRAIHDWSRFVCPRRDPYVEALAAGYGALAAQLQPELVSLDFIRHYVFWETVPLAGGGEIESGCYCPVCLDGFERAIGERVDRNAPAVWIRAHAWAAWAAWQTARIDEVTRIFAEAVRNASPASRIGVKLVPWRTDDLGGARSFVTGQEPVGMASFVDYFAPMAFTHVLGKDLVWKEALLRETKRMTGKPVMSFLQTDKLYRDEDLSLEAFQAELQSCLSDEWAGFPIFAYDQLSRSEAKADALRRALDASR